MPDFVVAINTVAIVQLCACQFQNPYVSMN